MNDLMQFVEVEFESLLFGIFMIKKWVEFKINLRSFGSLKQDCVIKIIEMFNLLPLIKNSVTIESRFLLLIISAIMSSKTINILCFLPILYSSIFCTHLAYHLNTQ